ncbi:hypothetical protein KSP40_PGU007966 [Platanthera guangdongensis]|uniref:Uncharacterized protein n=1 Tax=Platanthera guangdongensis TaxID=2320717 RepID=A0ABR2LY33_9ASPA
MRPAAVLLNKGFSLSLKSMSGEQIPASWDAFIHSFFSFELLPTSDFRQTFENQRAFALLILHCKAVNFCYTEFL